MPDTPTTTNWKSFLTGLACGVLVGAGGLYLFNVVWPGQTTDTQPISGSTPSGNSGAVNVSPPDNFPDRPADSVRVTLRAASFPCDPETKAQALEIKRAGWTYVMPQRRNTQAGWAARSTWWLGYWTNAPTGTTSVAQPQRAPNGKLVGDGKEVRIWRRGSSPPTSTKLEWLCSDSGGIPPQ